MWQRLSDHIQKRPAILVAAILVLLPFALLINLGLMPLMSDEPTRAIVTLEMILSGNYITPTINGDFYYNKPPLFNWILAGFIKITGSMDDVVFRIPTILSLLGLGLVLYFFTKKSLGKFNAFILAMMYVTSGRILFWDSFQGLIDVTYSLVTFGSFVVFYHFSGKRNYLAMFVFTYLLTAAGYMMKGLPSLAFQGISLMAWLWYEKSFKKLFTWQHLAGIGVLVVVLGSYYLAYLQNNSLENVFKTLFSESNRLNEEEGRFINWLLHLFSFPPELMYNFAPWPLLLLLLFNKNIREKAFKDRLSQFSLVIFAANIPIYWLSANMRARYLFMLVPFIFFLGLKALMESENSETRIRKVIIRILQVSAFLGALSLLIYFFWEKTSGMAGIFIIIPLLLAISLSAAALSLKIPRQTIAFVIIVLLSIRIGFNLFNQPARYTVKPEVRLRIDEIKVARMTLGSDLFILGKTPFDHDASFNMSKERMEIVSRAKKLADGPAFYMSDEKSLRAFKHELGDYEMVYPFFIKHKTTKLYLIKK